jgi:hypothetical protein
MRGICSFVTRVGERALKPVVFSLLSLLADAQRLSDPTWDADFYDQVPGYVPSFQRGTFTASVKLPAGAQNASAVLSASGYHFQDSALDPSAYQYWADIVNGTVTIPRVKAGTYRLTVYAKGTTLATIRMVTMAYAKPGIFGDYVEDGLVIDAGKTLAHNVTWTAESAGRLSSPVPARISKALTSFLQARSSGGSELLTRPRASSRTASSATLRTRAHLPVR